MLQADHAFSELMTENMTSILKSADQSLRVQPYINEKDVYMCLFGLRCY